MNWLFLSFAMAVVPQDPKELASYKNKLRERYPGLISKVIQKRLMRVSRFLINSRYKDAIAILEKMAGKKYRRYEMAKIWQMLAFAYAQSQDYPKSRKAFAKLLSLDVMPQKATLESLFALAQLQALDKDFNNAQKNMGHWFALSDQETPHAHAFMASILYEKNQKRRALTSMIKAASLAKSPKESWLVFIVSLLYEQKKYNQAVHYLRTLIKLKPLKKMYWTQMAGNLISVNQGLHALAALRLAMMMELLDKEGEILNAASLYLANKLPYEASLLLQDALAKKLIKPSKKNFELLANCLIQAREFKAAMGPLSQAAQQAKTGKLYALQARILLEQGEYKKALPVFDLALGKSLKKDQRGKILVEKGITLIELGMIEKAKKVMLKAAAYEESAKLARNWQNYLNHF